MTCTPRFIRAAILFALPWGLAISAEPPLVQHAYPKEGFVVIGMIVMGCVGLGYLFLTRLRDSSNLNY